MSRNFLTDNLSDPIIANLKGKAAKLLLDHAFRFSEFVKKELRFS